MSFSPDGRLLAGGGESGNVHVIDTGTWRAREAVAVRDAESLQLEWLRDDRTLVLSGVDGTVLLFDTERALVRTVPLPASVDRQQGNAYLVPDPKDELVVFNDDRPGLRYPMEPTAWLREACAVAGRDLTPAEWNRYLPDREYRPTCTDLG
jgi:WD40 repeat protein